MFHHSKILVWYQVASQKVILGEALSGDKQDVISMWLKAPEEENQAKSLGYRLSLFDDDGREIADKAVSMLTADELLSGIQLRV
ncbi:hypothetical protein ACODM8_01150 [Vibrio ostreicida]|uniref:30S ribosomal protein S6 modification protein n=1 Tax=Vibrio ostreicida TaxID=526588 RepID=A0ABT8BU09_9VIBR|nr:30S ribosomal protein S6 modification protein [Vibrio ostreicida]MDN3609869.1 hypothetical protein [Vibrio ostreicida]NPD09991.1 30S ribosomal protein S6 modification protein [Vibrio ostreicida]